MKNMKFCPKCGAKCKDDDYFCAACGTKFKDKINSDNQELTQATVEETRSERIRYANGPLGYIKPEVFWPIAGIIFYLFSLYNGPGFVQGLISGIIWGLLVFFLRRPDDNENKYAATTIFIVVILISF